MTSSSRSPCRRPLLGIVAIFFVSHLFLSLVESALAHPLDDFTIRRINQYFIVDARGQQPAIFYLLKMAEIPSFEEMNKIDPDYSRDVTAEEVTAYLDQRIPELLENLHMAVDGVSVPLSVENRRLKIQKGKGGLAVINVHLVLKPGAFAWPDAGQVFELMVRSDNFAGDLGERECKLLHNGRLDDRTSVLDENTLELQKIIDRDDLGNAIYQDAGALFVFRLALVETQVAASHTEPDFDWIANANLMAAGQDKTVLAFSGQTDPQKVQGQPEGVVPIEEPEPAGSVAAELSSKDGGTGVLDRMFGRVAGMIRAKELTTAMFVSGLLIAMILGMAHAWSPGHGKTVMAAYLIGERGTTWNAIVLGLVVTITHTWSVLGLGVVTLYAQDRISSEQLNFWLSIASGGIIVSIGIMLFFRRYATFVLVRHGKKSGYSHHSHDHDQPHEHDHHGHSHVVKTDDGSPPSIWSILGLGISGGIVPCPSALIVLLLAIQFKRLAYGLWLILSFSLGLAFVLVAIGIMVVRAAGVVRKATGGGAALAMLPVISSVLITILGLALLVGTLVQYGFLVIRP